jgi:hypothetical protein
MQWIAIGEDSLKILDDRIVFGDISIPFENIVNATLNQYPEDKRNGSLIIDTNAGKYMFNFQQLKFEDIELPFPVSKTNWAPIDLKKSLAIKVMLWALFAAILLTAWGIIDSKI